MVSLSHPSHNLSQIAKMPIGERDARLLEIREELFGPVFNNATNCPQCKKKMEWEMTVDAIRLKPNLSPINAELYSLEYDGNLIQFRLPNTTDIMEVMALEKGVSKEEVLLKKCIAPGSLPTAYSDKMPEAFENAFAQKMEEYDPQSDIKMAILCPVCGHNWDMIFDIMSYLWSEIEDWATHLLQDIFLLAKNFGWSENDILEMGSFRRGLYLKMLYG